MEYFSLNFIYGLSIMFYGMLTWLFFCKGDKLSKLVAILMCTICIGYIKDLFFICKEIHTDIFYWSAMTSVDMIAVPMYAHILMELVKPGMVTRRLMICQILPFALLSGTFIISKLFIFYYILIALCIVYGISVMLWSVFMIPRYNRQLMERFSYTENINLSWLRIILYSFALILVLWVLDCLLVKLYFGYIYMIGSLAIWMVFGFFIYKHKSVIEELKEYPVSDSNDIQYSEIPPNVPNLSHRITTLFNEQKIFLNPHLKISDVAIAAGSNRTYVSNYFNREIGTTFYDYVNNLRIEYSCRLLESTDMSIRNIAEESGFNSHQAYIRVFSRSMGITPKTFRSKSQTH